MSKLSSDRWELKSPDGKVFSIVPHAAKFSKSLWTQTNAKKWMKSEGLTPLGMAMIFDDEFVYLFNKLKKNHEPIFTPVRNNRGVSIGYQLTRKQASKLFGDKNKE